MPRLSESIADYCILREMSESIRAHLNAALLECSALSRDLATLDPDAVRAALAAQFGPEGTVQDCFADAFHDGRCKLADAGAEPLTATARYLMGVE